MHSLWRSTTEDPLEANMRQTNPRYRGHRSSTATIYFAALAVTSIAGCGGGGGGYQPLPIAATPTTPTTPATTTPSASDQCAALSGAKIAAADIGLPTKGATIQSATLVLAKGQSSDSAGAAVAAIPEYCKVLGAIAPVDPAGFAINFQVNLPTNWNGKTMQMGGGGMNGSVGGTATDTIKYPQRPDRPLPLTSGYVTFGSDSGHAGNNGAFLLNYEATVNFGYAQMKKTRDVAQLLLTKRYSSKPTKNYCFGHSNGGRDCMAAVQRYPMDYDGIIAAEPVVHYTGDMLHNVRIANSLVDAGWLNAAKTKLVASGARTACDADDGAADGRVLKYASCNFDVKTLRCPSGTDEGNSCLSDAQLRTVAIIQNPVTPLPLANGGVYPGFQWKGGEDMADGYARVWMGTTPPLKVEPSGPAFQSNVGFILVYGRSFVRYWFGQSDSYQTYDFDESKFQSRISEISSIIDATDPDLSAFFAHGGKLIMKDNSHDYAQSPQQRIEYIDAMKKVVGAQAIEDNFRWYVAPGSGHFGLEGAGQTDLVSLLENWAEKGQAPADSQVAVRLDPNTLEQKESMAMCRYPLYPRYKGSGSLSDAASFACSAP